MKSPIRILCFLLFTTTYFSLSAQLKEYKYKREIQGVSNVWHKIILPDEIFGKTSQDLADIRIFGLTPNNDTIEIPYILRLTKGKTSTKEVAFKMLNTSHTDKGYYFTFEIPTEEIVNEIKTDFSKQNFDWRITLEGSHNQTEWFTIVENYRIVSIKNKLTDFRFTTITFPNSKYRFFRLFINSKDNPGLKVASIVQHESINGLYKKYNIQNITVKENKKSKQTEIDVTLQLSVRINTVNIVVSDSFDYYRPVTIKYLKDSFKTELGWKYNYARLTSGYLNSIEGNEFRFSNTTVKKLKIVIDNGSNIPLTIDTVKVKGYIHELVARFTEKATYFLAYGNNNAVKPNYDIEHFVDKIPGAITQVNLGNELMIEKEKQQEQSPLFENKMWLWGIMLVIIILLVWFTMKMMRNS